MNKGIIYLIQPVELIGTERYKIGMSGNPNLNRCINGYKKGSRYICIMECNNPLILEKNIKRQFNKKFKLIAGKEYYEGNEKDMLNVFNNLVIEHYDKNSDDMDSDIDNLNEIENEFKNYKEDIEFGGTKKLIKIYIHPYLTEYGVYFKFIDNREINGEYLCINNINHCSFNYIKNIIDKKIIQNGNIYDLNNKSFQKNINQYKKIYNNVIFSKEINDKIIEIVKQPLEKNTIEYLFKIDCLINNTPCYSYHNEHSFLFHSCYYHIDFSIYMLDNKYYDELYLRKYIPYCIEFNKITKNYYIINRDYEYIGYDNIKCLKDIENDIDENQNDCGWSRIFIFNNMNKPWINKTNFKNYLKNYNQIKINNSLNVLKNNNTSLEKIHFFEHFFSIM